MILTPTLSVNAEKVLLIHQTYAESFSCTSSRVTIHTELSLSSDYLLPEHTLTTTTRLLRTIPYVCNRFGRKTPGSTN